MLRARRRGSCMRPPRCGKTSNFRAFSQCQRIFHIDTKVSDRAFDFGVS